MECQDRGQGECDGPIEWRSSTSAYAKARCKKHHEIRTAKEEADRRAWRARRNR